MQKVRKNYLKKINYGISYMQMGRYKIFKIQKGLKNVLEKTEYKNKV